MRTWQQKIKFYRHYMDYQLIYKVRQVKNQEFFNRFIAPHLKLYQPDLIMSIIHPYFLNFHLQLFQ